MMEYIMITDKDADLYSKEEIIRRYNLAIEEIYHLRKIIMKLHEENDAWMAAYEKAADKLYG